MHKLARLTHLLLLFVMLVSCAPQPQVEPSVPAPPTLDASVLAARETALAATQLVIHATAAPTRTATPTLTLTPTATLIPPTPTITLTPTPQFEAFASTQRILLHEDIAQSAGEARPFVAEALKRTGYPYTSTNGNIGTLKDYLAQKWDLIIIAAEMKANMQGEFLDLIDSHVYQGGALIMETWLLDKALKGKKFNYMLSSCGMEVQGDYKETNFRSIQWAAADHALLQGPNQGMSLEKFIVFWKGDIGDLLRKKPGSTAQIIASTSGSTESEAVLTSCFGGRVILQTFSSHDHKEEDMVPLWENYIDYSLQARYQQQQLLAQLPPDPLVAFKEEAQILVYKPVLGGVRSIDVPYIDVLTYAGMQVTAKVNTAQMGSYMLGNWDLIVAADYTNEVVADFLTPMRRQLEQGGAVVFEKSVLQAATPGGLTEGAINTFLSHMGVQNAGIYAVSQRLPVDWMDPEHSLAAMPFLVHMPTANRLGSLVTLLPDSQAQLIAGTERDGEPAGFVFTGYDGRLVMQTIQSSQYDPWSMFQAWESYIDYALRQRMLYLEANP